MHSELPIIKLDNFREDHTGQVRSGQVRVFNVDIQNKLL